ncbi:hypothetical protein V5O48_018833, partial [Marasmius crinis-equi]
MGKRTGNPRGRASWAKGERLQVLESLKPMWYVDSTAFYNQATDTFRSKWGNYPLSRKLEDAEPGEFELCDINEITDIDARNAEIQKREEFRKNTRRKIASWANNKWGEKKAAESPALNALFDEMTEITKIMPRKPAVVQYYQTRYWDE